jgi:uncharacterized membrane protein
MIMIIIIIIIIIIFVFPFWKHTHRVSEGNGQKYCGLRETADELDRRNNGKSDRSFECAYYVIYVSCEGSTL